MIIDLTATEAAHALTALSERFTTSRQALIDMTVGRQVHDADTATFLVEEMAAVQSAMVKLTEALAQTWGPQNFVRDLLDHHRNEKKTS